MSNKTFTKFACVARLTAALAFLLAGCGGNDGAAGPAGPPGTTGSNGVPVTDTAQSLVVTIDSVTIASPPVVKFTLTNEDGTRYVGLTASQIRFTLAKLVPGSNGSPAAWQSYVNRTETKGAGAWGAGGSAIQADYDRNGTFVSNGDGSYQYTFKTDVKNVTTPLAVSWQPTFTHRLGIQIYSGAPITNFTYDWRPSDGATTGLVENDIVQTASCNECHGKLAVHGGSRVDTKYCVTCHNPGTTDANTGNTLDFKVFIHKLHRGDELPSVIGGTPYVIYGFNDEPADFSDVAYPQDIRNCTKCHDSANPATPQAHFFEDTPNRAACGSCHDNVDFATGQGHTPTNVPEPDDSQCTVCHSSTGFPGSVADTHTNPFKAESAKYAFTIVDVTINPDPNLDPNDNLPVTQGFPVITYKVTDPTNSNALYDVRSTGPDPHWVNGSLSLLVAWSTSDFNNKGNGSATTPASPVTLNGRTSSSGNNAAPTKNADGTFTVTSLRGIDRSATQLTIGMYGRAAADFNGDGVYGDRVPVTSVTTDVTIPTGGTPVARRTVADIAKCDKCHDVLTLHGSARTDNIELCTQCHNPRNTDRSQRATCIGASNCVDGLTDRTIDFKYLVHAIHGSEKRTDPYIVYGNNSSTNDFSTVRFPGVLNNCATCHASTSYTVPLKPEVQATTFVTNVINDQTDDDVTTPTATVCSSCHDTSVAQTHMEQNGAQFSVLAPANNGAETCEVCHGSGRIADVSVVHSVQ